MKWSIGDKIRRLFIVAILFFIVLGTVSYRTVNKLIASSDWNSHTQEVLHLNETLISNFKDAETGQRGYIITGEESYLEPYNSALQTVYQNLKQLTELTKDNPNQQKRLATYKVLIDEKFAELQETIDLRKEEGFNAALEIVMSNKGKISMDNFRKVAADFENEETELLALRSLEMNSNANTTKSVIIYGNLLAILLLSVFGWFTASNISRPLKTVTNLATRVSKGDLTVDFPLTKRKDEVGLLNRAFFNMIRNLRNQISEIDQSINVLSSSSSEIMASVNQLSSTAAETATSVSETSTTVEEVKQTAEVASFKAREVSDGATKNVRISKKGEKAVEDTIEGINVIQKQMDAIVNIVVRLSEQSQKIGEITASVYDLAEQSNLLAVNAAIEAAKAGDSGKGFSVVAQEIRKLSERSKESSLQIKNILVEVQKSISTAVMATEEGNKAVSEGLKLSAISGESIKELSDSVANSVNAAIQIAASSQEQVEGMDQVAIAIESIKEASLQSSASSKQSAVAVKDVQKMSQNLQRLMEQYKM